MVMARITISERVSNRLANPQAATWVSPRPATAAIASMAASGGISWLTMAGAAMPVKGRQERLASGHSASIVAHPRRYSLRLVNHKPTTKAMAVAQAAPGNPHPPRA